MSYSNVNGKMTEHRQSDKQHNQPSVLTVVLKGTETGEGQTCHINVFARFYFFNST